MTTQEKIEDIEGKIDVNTITVEKFGRVFQIYPWLRSKILYKEQTGTETLQKKTIGLLFRQVLSVFYGCWNLFSKNEIWAFTNSTERRLVNGKYYDKLFDYIGNECGKKMLLIELRLFTYYPYRKIASKRAVSKSIFILLEEFYSRFILRLPKITNEEVLVELNLQFESSISQKEIIKKYLSQYRMMRFWLKVLPNPKVVYVSVSYTNFGYIRAFKEKGIQVVEFQHGLITSNHSAYWYKQSFDPVQFPDQIVTVGEQELNVFGNGNAFPVKDVIPVGSFILDHYSDKDEKSYFSQPLRVLFALQDTAIGDKFASFIADLSEQINSIEIIVQTRRTSPEYYLKKYPALHSVEFSNDSVYAALIESDVHVTVYSTTAIEALSLGRQNILVNIDGLSVTHLSSKLKDNPFTKIVDTVPSFIAAIEKIQFIDKRVIQESNRFNIKPGYKHNIQNFLNRTVE
ncbi:MAG: hypothetical protein P8H43_01680 [Crocinitomicaceae bacterium]|jgi:hypothetical protein|nr:hypothetical protein [Crocinitomicaceae bacterium]MDG1741269.1 hypothetical protein [Crocinitomicaceae bacterium]